MVFHNRMHLVDHLASDSPRCLYILLTTRHNPAFHIDYPLSGPTDGQHGQGVQLSRRHVVVPTRRAPGPLVPSAERILETMTQQEARDELAATDPDADFIPALPPAMDAVPALGYVPNNERYPTRLFLTERYTGVAAESVPAAICRREYFVLNLYCGRRRGGDIQAQV